MPRIENPDFRFHANEYYDNKTVLYFGNTSLQDIIYVGSAVFKKAQPSITPHVHESCFEITYHVEGNQTYFIKNKPHYIRPGAAFIAFPDEEHSTGIFQQEISKFYYITFIYDAKSKSFLGLDQKITAQLIASLLGITDHIVYDVFALEAIFSELITTYEGTHPLREERLRYLILELLYQFLQGAKVNKTKSAIPEDIGRVLLEIEERPYYKFSMEEFAGIAALSESYFKRKFKQYVGLSPHTYAMRVRMSLAGDMLAYTDISIIDIAIELGFSSSQHFSSAFRKFEGQSPSNYRKIIRQSSARRRW